jgi:hypothetical protein
MARLKPKTHAIEHTLTWDFPQSGLHLDLEMRQMESRAWYDSAESHDPTWQTVENKTSGYVVAVRPRLT